MNKVSKESVFYRKAIDSRRCGNCVMYKNRTCTLVAGNIDPAYVCDRWEGKRTEREVYIIRHGATAMNSESGGPDRIRSWRNLPLSPEGHREIHKLGQELANHGIATCVSSDLQRARETAQAVAKTNHAEVILNSDLRPWDLGEFTGQESRVVTPEIIKFAQQKPERKIPGGESFDEFKERAFKGVREACDDYPVQYLAIVTHHRVERLIKAWQAAGFPADKSIDFSVMFSPGEKTAHAEKIKIDLMALNE